MAGPVKKSDSKQKVRRTLVTVAEYEAAVARLSDTETQAWVSIMKVRLQQHKDNLETHKSKLAEEVVTKIMTEVYTERLSSHHEVLVISITDLAQIATTETKAWQAAVDRQLNVCQIQDTHKSLKHELEEMEHGKERLQADFNKSTENTGDDVGVKGLTTAIEDYVHKIRASETELLNSFEAAYLATVAMNRAVKSDLAIPGVGKYFPIPAPVTITAAQVSVKDIASILEAKGTDIEVDTMSGTAIPAPKSVTAVVKLDQQFSSIQICSPQKSFQDVERIKRRKFEVGDIGWFPVLRPSMVESPSDIHTEFGYICAKNYPLIIVEKLRDCMLGLLINTSGGKGLSKKGPSVMNRSVPIVKYPLRDSPPSLWGHELYPKQVLNVQMYSNYTPPTGAYVDMLNTIMIPYDSRFRREGTIVDADILPLQQMRLSALLATSQAGHLENMVGFCKWMWSWGYEFGVMPRLGEHYRRYCQAKVDNEQQQKEKAEAKSRKKAETKAQKNAEAKAKIEAKARSEAKEREEVKERDEAKKREEVQELERAMRREQAKEIEELKQTKATWQRMFAMGREDAKIQMDRNVRALTRGPSWWPAWSS
ncbi:uncharacterized protein J4E88_010679 [Alternaria novae-zelandiae]|uniref:uncharacterized protein n=1 Tax=Alternaria novae-zelandiae TaxID=430562 RepID=UPI0020C1F5D0|nr:uncharacterized protein J4E88_010679 [Alternaria novae-zelandiae]KAI4664535.1 hypothetical protein J4E88_010679 [Alternaria novae-zelandiae]